MKILLHWEGIGCIRWCESLKRLGLCTSHIVAWGKQTSSSDSLPRAHRFSSTIFTHFLPLIVRGQLGTSWSNIYIQIIG